MPVLEHMAFTALIVYASRGRAGFEAAQRGPEKCEMPRFGPATLASEAKSVARGAQGELDEHSDPDVGCN